MATYFTILTTIGQAKIANAVALGQQIQLTEMALGDGNGNPTTPNQGQTALVRQVYRAQLNQLSTDPSNPNYVIAELVVPSDVGGWTVREVGLYDVDGQLIAVGNFPDTYKPQLSEGASRDLVVRIIIEVSNASVVQLKIDPSIVLASRQWVVSQFLLRSKVAGGLAGQVLTKRTNTDEDFQWRSPSDAVNVLVDVIPERQTLAAGQTVVNFALINASGISVYVDGVRLIETIDYAVTGTAQITLTSAYPAGSVIHAYQNEALDQIASATTEQRGLVELATTDEGNAGTAGKVVDAAVLKAVLASLGAQLTPPGAVQAFACATAPTGWLKCNGGAVSRTTYNALFAAIGTTFGVGDGSSTFNLPDLRGEFIRGLDDGRGADAGRVLGSAQGFAVQTHSHYINTRSLNPGSVTSLNDDAGTLSQGDLTLTGAGNWQTATFGESGVFASETRPRNVALLYCIKA
jgi:phage-related tail fiber protein